MARRVLNYRTEGAAQGALKRLVKRYPHVYPNCKLAVVSSPHWQFPFRYLIQVTGIDGRVSYWSAAR